MGQLRHFSLLEFTIMIVYTHYQSPVGVLTIQANDDGLLGAWFQTQTTQPDNLGKLDSEHPVLKQAVSEYQEYFAGTRQMFEVPLAATGTEFQQKVWQALTTIPYGTTWSYQDLANAIGNPKAVRAVGLANGRIRFRSLCPAIGLSGKMVSSPAMPAV